jgi:hypothetical protein
VISQNEVAQQATRFITQRHTPGDELISSELRRRVPGRFGERKVVINASNAFLRTLLYFGVLEDGGKLGAYRFCGRLAVPREVFPLAVWTLWQRQLSPQVGLEDFRTDPALAFLSAEQLASHWQAYQPQLWVLEERIEGRRATLKYADAAGFEQALLQLVSDK